MLSSEGPQGPQGPAGADGAAGADGVIDITDGPVPEGVTVQYLVCGSDGKYYCIDGAPVDPGTGGGDACDTPGAAAYEQGGGSGTAGQVDQFRFRVRANASNYADIITNFDSLLDDPTPVGSFDYSQGTSFSTLTLTYPVEGSDDLIISFDADAELKGLKYLDESSLIVDTIYSFGFFHAGFTYVQGPGATGIKGDGFLSFEADLNLLGGVWTMPPTATPANFQEEDERTEALWKFESDTVAIEFPVSMCSDGGDDTTGACVAYSEFLGNTSNTVVLGADAVYNFTWSATSQETQDAFESIVNGNGTTAPTTDAYTTLRFELDGQYLDVTGLTDGAIADEIYIYYAGFANNLWPYGRYEIAIVDRGRSGASTSDMTGTNESGSIETLSDWATRVSAGTAACINIIPGGNATAVEGGNTPYPGIQPSPFQATQSGDGTVTLSSHGAATLFLDGSGLAAGDTLTFISGIQGTYTFTVGSFTLRPDGTIFNIITVEPWSAFPNPIKNAGTDNGYVYLA